MGTSLGKLKHYYRRCKAADPIGYLAHNFSSSVLPCCGAATKLFGKRLKFSSTPRRLRKNNELTIGDNRVTFLVVHDASCFKRFAVIQVR